MRAGVLYIVATPIGNLEDISKRAIETLSSVDLILAEDTRVAKKLLSRFGIEKPLESYHQHSGEAKLLQILNMLINGAKIALVSDAGTPGISDPGNELVDFIYENTVVHKHAAVPANPNDEAGVQIISIPGPSSVATALSVCGFDVSQHIFLGFWPKKKKNEYLKLIAEIEMSVVFFESPHRILKTLQFLADEIGQRRVFVGRELTKMHETHYRGSFSDVVEELELEKHLKGEIVVVVE